MNNLFPNSSAPLDLLVKRGRSNCENLLEFMKGLLTRSCNRICWTETCTSILKRKFHFSWKHKFRFPIPPEKYVPFLFPYPLKSFRFHFRFTKFCFRFRIFIPFSFFLEKFRNFLLYFHPY
jgi:hypothetical protein